MFLQVVLTLSIFIMLFTAVAEWLFWDEFGSRFNFIAVDYLLYTHEVLGNIWQSYPVGQVLAGLLALALGCVFLLRRVIGQAAAAPLSWRAAAAVVAVWAVACAVAVAMPANAASCSKIMSKLRRCGIGKSGASCSSTWLDAVAMAIGRAQSAKKFVRRRLMFRQHCASVLQARTNASRSAMWHN